MTSIKELRDEYSSSTFGKAMLARVTDVMRSLLSRRDPLVYAQGAHSARDGLDDVVNSFILDELLHPDRPQIRYIMDTSTTLDDFDRLLAWHARRYLARQRARSLAGNLVDRSRHRLADAPFAALQCDGRNGWGLAGRTYTAGATTQPGEIRTAAILARGVPTLKVTAVERLPKMYDAKGLEAVLRLLVDTASGIVDIRDLQAFFDLLFTAWSTGHLEQHDEQTAGSEPLSAEEYALAALMALQLADLMTDEQSMIFLYYWAGLSDARLGTDVRLSRPTVIKRRKELFTRIEGHLADLSEPVRIRTLADLYVHVAARGLEAP